MTGRTLAVELVAKELGMPLCALHQTTLDKEDCFGIIDILRNSFMRDARGIKKKDLLNSYIDLQVNFHLLEEEQKKKEAKASTTKSCLKQIYKNISRCIREEIY